MRSNSPRRRFLQLAGVGFATSLAGCQTPLNPRRPPTDGYNGEPGPDTDPDPTPVKQLAEPPATFRTTATQYTYRELRIFDNIIKPNEYAPIKAHAGTDVFEITVEDADTITVTIEEVSLNRALGLTLHIRDAAHNYHERETTLEAPESDAFTTITRTFDIPDITLPKPGVGGHIILSLTDVHPNGDKPRLGRLHQYVAIEHKGGIEWMNSPRFNRYQPHGGDSANVLRFRNIPYGVEVNGTLVRPSTRPAGAIKTIDGDTERTVLMGVRTLVNGEVYGVSCHIDHEAIRKYRARSEVGRLRHNFMYEAYYATEISHLRELGKQTAEAITGIGITEARARIQALGELTQMLPYTRQPWTATLTQTLYNSTGDCSTKSILLTSILQNDPWNQQNAVIDCTVNGGRHFVAGIDVRHLDGNLEDPMSTVRPRKQELDRGVKDSEYAFFEQTIDAQLGYMGTAIGGFEDEPLHVEAMSDFSSWWANNPPPWTLPSAPDY
jgi:hypothetical protein